MAVKLVGKPFVKFQETNIKKYSKKKLKKYCNKTFEGFSGSFPWAICERIFEKMIDKPFLRSLEKFPSIILKELVQNFLWNIN